MTPSRGLEARILGPLELVEDGHALPLRGARQIGLAASLIVHANEVVAAERLLDELWPDEPASGLAALRVRVSQLRRAVGRWGERLETRPGGYVLHAEDDEVDAPRFERLARQGRDLLAAGAPEEAAAALGAALELWRGPALDGAGDAPSIRAAAARLDELRLAAVEDSLEAALALGGHAEAAAELEALSSEHPLRERLLELRLRALYRAGRQAEALAAYREGRSRLVDTLGIEPGPRLRALEQAILRQDDVLLGAARRRLRPAVRLPTPASSFVGRGGELAAAEALVRERDPRLLTLVGTGGVGKTRLAIELARALADTSGSATTFVSLAPVRDPAAVVPTLARGLGVAETEGLSPAESLAHRLGGQRALVVLDNVEHLLGAAPELAQLLETAPGLRVVATSREPLRIAGEVQVEVGPLAPEEAVELYVARCAAAGQNVDDSPAVHELCERLDRLPLALELAAARARALTPEQLLDRLGERLDLLVGGRDADPRQRTLRATLEWSHDLLSPDEQRLFARLSVFAGGWTLDAAEEVCDARVDTVASLLDKSLIRRSGERYTMLETIREYARERLAESGAEAETTERFVDRVLRPIERAMPASGPPSFAEVAHYDGELDNLRASLAYVVEHDPRRLLERALAVFFALEMQGILRERFEWIDRIMDAGAGLDDTLRAKGLALQAVEHQFHGRLDEAQRTAETAIALAAPDDILTQGQASFAIAANAILAGDFERGIELTEALVEFGRTIGDPVPEAVTLERAGLAHWMAGHVDVARRLLEQALAVRRQSGLPELFDVYTHACLGLIELESGDHARALAHFRHTLAESVARGTARPMGFPLLATAVALHRAGDDERAARLFGFVEANHHQAEIQIVPQAAGYRRELAAALGDSDAAREGRLLPLDEALALALADTRQLSR